MAFCKAGPEVLPSGDRKHYESVSTGTESSYFFLYANSSPLLRTVRRHMGLSKFGAGEGVRATGLWWVETRDSAYS